MFIDQDVELSSSMVKKLLQYYDNSYPFEVAMDNILIVKIFQSKGDVIDLGKIS